MLAKRGIYHAERGDPGVAGDTTWSTSRVPAEHARSPLPRTDTAWPKSEVDS